MNDIFWQYAEQLTTPEDEILYQLRRETYLKTLFPRMLSGPIQGKLLEFISKLAKPSKILEIGTFTGYSTICLARGLTDNGELITIEINDELEPIISKYLKKAGLTGKVRVIFGDAKTVLNNLTEKFDIVFIDAEKKHYLEYYKLVFEKVKLNGLILVDNIFWNGKIFQPVEPNDTYTRGVLEFNNYVKNDDRVERLVLPVRDGFMILRKIKD